MELYYVRLFGGKEPIYVAAENIADVIKAVRADSGNDPETIEHQAPRLLVVEPDGK